MINIFNNIYETFYNGFLSLFFPTQCKECGRYIKNFKYLYVCENCFNKIKIINENYCKICNKPIFNSSVNICKDCQNEKKYFSFVRSSGIYEGTLKTLIHEFKFYKKKKLVKLLSEFILKNVRREIFNDIDYISYIPISKKTYYLRGYNQSYLIAKYISKKVDIKIKDLLIKIKETKPQRELTKEERKKNIKGAFSLKNNVNIINKKILIVDDVYTTGATMNEAAKVLKKNGVKEIRGLVIARGNV